MIAVLISLVLSGPMQKINTSVQVVYHPDECVGGQIVCPFSRFGRYCVCAPAEINLGEWDPRPNSADWDHCTYTDPPAFGTYPTEKQP